MNRLSQNSWEFLFQPAAAAFADNSINYLWGPKQAWSTTQNGYLFYNPTRNMLLTDITFYTEPNVLASTEPSVLSINERQMVTNSASYSVHIRDMIITKNFTWNYSPHPFGLCRRFEGLAVPMMVGKLYGLKMSVPAMATNPTSMIMSIALKGVYDDILLKL